MSTEQANILLIQEHESDFLRIQKALFEIPDDRYKLSWVSSFEEGAAALLSEDYDVYLVDYGMGENDTLNLLETALEQDVNCPFILLTDCNDRELDLKAMACGAADFLVKEELTANKLDRSIRYTLQLNRTIKELRKSEERLHEAQALARIGHFDWDVKTNTIYWSDEHYRIFGLAPQSIEISYQKFLSFLSSEEVLRVNEAMRFLQSGGEFRSLAYQIKLPKEKIKYLQATMKAERSPSGELIRITGTTQDVTEQTEKARHLLALETAVENAAIPMAFADLDNRLSYINQAYLDTWGYSDKEEVIGQFPEGFGHSKHQISAILEHLHSDGYWKGEALGRKKDDTPFHIFLSTKLIHDEAGKVLGSMATFIDITALKEQEAALRKEKERAHMYLEMAGSLILVVEKNEKVSLVNREGASVLGYVDTEIIGQNWFDNFIPKTERQEVRQLFHDIMNGRLEQREYHENKIITKNGQQKLIRWYNRLLPDEQGNPVATISSGIDITQARQNEKELQESRVKLKRYTEQLEAEVKRQTKALAENQAKLKEATSLAKIGYWEIDLQQDLQLSWSEEFYQLYEVNEKAPSGDRNYFMPFVHVEDRAKVRQNIKRAIAEGIDVHFEFRIQTPTQKEKYLRAELQCQKNTEGVLQKIFSIVQDITDQKRSAQQLEQALQKEKELSLMKSRFVSMASHEFRTPLTSILASAGLIEMYRERGNLEKQIKHVERIKSSVSNLTSILNDFLSLEKLESGKINFNAEQVHLPLFINEVKEEISLVTRKDQLIEYQHFGEETVFIDQHLVKNILINLLSNAIKYSPKGQAVLLSTRLEDHRLIITVQDRGIGIPEEDQRQMFTRFFRASNAANIKGTGLGLTIVKRYLDLMGGKISFVSKLNEGTTFTVQIPQ